MHTPDPDDLNRPAHIKGGGAARDREGQFEALAKWIEDDGWYREEGRNNAATADACLNRNRALDHQPQRIA